MFIRRSVGVLTALCTGLAMCCCSTSENAKAGPPPCPSNEVVGWGDSLTYSLTEIGGVWQQAHPTWLDTVGEDLGVDTENFGVQSQGSAEIAVRQGGLKPLVTLSGDQIPSGSTAAIPITAISPTDGWTQYARAGTMKMHGAMAGASGTLQHTMTSGVESFAFVPDAAPASDVPVPAESKFSSDDGDKYRGCTQIVWAGTNNSSQTAAITRDIASMYYWLPYPKRYLIIGTIPATKDALSEAYGPNFVDLRTWLISDGLSAAGIAPTPDDTEAVTAGNIPPSLSVDGAHFTQAGYTAIGHHLASVIKNLD
jgi:hypothetical protein